MGGGWSPRLGLRLPWVQRAPPSRLALCPGKAGYLGGSVSGVKQIHCFLLPRIRVPVKGNNAWPGLASAHQRLPTSSHRGFLTSHLWELVGPAQQPGRSQPGSSHSHLPKVTEHTRTKLLLWVLLPCCPQAALIDLFGLHFNSWTPLRTGLSEFSLTVLMSPRRERSCSLCCN